MDAPGLDQVEINVFGPGFGESCLVHCGGNHWIVIDSCVSGPSVEPAALVYLRKIGVDPSSAVRLIIATHWHDDHVRGISKLVKVCESARFCTSSALSRPEFIEVLEAYNQNRSLVGGTGASEMCKTLRVLKERKPPRFPIIRAAANKRLLKLDAGTLDLKYPVEIWALSPSESQFERALMSLSRLMPEQSRTMRRLGDQEPNDLAIVVWISVGRTGLLFGSDLEESGDNDLGWSAIVSSEERPSGKAVFFKIPHHGSQNAHHDGTWRKMLEPQPLAILTPWNRGRGLPKIRDLDRISRLTENCFSTAGPRTNSVKRRSPLIERQLRESAIRLRPIQPKMGHVRLRTDELTDNGVLHVELFEQACSLHTLIRDTKEIESGRSTVS